MSTRYTVETTLGCYGLYGTPREAFQWAIEHGLRSGAFAVRAIYINL